MNDFDWSTNAFTAEARNTWIPVREWWGRCRRGYDTPANWFFFDWYNN